MKKKKSFFFACLFTLKEMKQMPHKVVCYSRNCHNDPKFSDRQVCAQSVDPDQIGLAQSDQGLHCLPFSLHYLEERVWHSG